MSLDKELLFKIGSWIAIVLGGLLILVSIITVAGVGLATSQMGETVQGGMTFFTLLGVAFPIIAGVVSLLAGRAGLQSDPDRCRKLTLIIVGVLAFNFLRSLIHGGSFSFLTLLIIAFYGAYCYLAHTASY